MDDFGRLDTEHGRAEIAKLRKVARRSDARPPLIARSLVVAVYAALHESAFGTKQDMAIAVCNVCFWHKADMAIAVCNVRFWGFPVTPLKTQPFFAIFPLNLWLALQRGRKGP